LTSVSRSSFYSGGQ